MGGDTLGGTLYVTCQRDTAKSLLGWIWLPDDEILQAFVRPQ